MIFRKFSKIKVLKVLRNVCLVAGLICAVGLVVGTVYLFAVLNGIGYKPPVNIPASEEIKNSLSTWQMSRFDFVTPILMNLFPVSLLVSISCYVLNRLYIKERNNPKKEAVEM